MDVIQYDVGPGAYGVARADDGAVWTSLTGRGELARVSPDGQVSRGVPAAGGQHALADHGRAGRHAVVHP